MKSPLFVSLTAEWWMGGLVPRWICIVRASSSSFSAAITSAKQICIIDAAHFLDLFVKMTDDLLGASNIDYSTYNAALYLLFFQLSNDFLRHRVQQYYNNCITYYRYCIVSLYLSIYILTLYIFDAVGKAQLQQ